MTYRVRIEPDIRVDGIALQIGRKAGDLGIEQLLYGQPERELHQPAVTWPRPSLTLPDDLGRALLDELAAYYGGVAGGRQQRADYEHERARVDRLIGHLIGGTQLPPGMPR